MSSPMSRDQIRAHLTGPVASVLTPFDIHGNIDFDSLRNFIDCSIAGGSRSLVLTAGNSLFTVLTDDEVAELTRVVVEHTARRAMVVAADRVWWTGKTVQFAQYVRDVGADVLMVLPPDWGSSCTKQTIVDHYRAVAEYIPVMIVTNVFMPRGLEFGLQTLKAVRDTVDGVVALKDDVCNEFARRVSLLVHDRWAVIAGGQKQNHINMLPFGCDGYFSTFVSIKPDITRRYWSAIQSHDLDSAVQIVRDCEMPLFDFIKTLEGNYHAARYAMLELFGIAQRWRRKPYSSLCDEEVEKLAAFLKSKRWL